MKQTLVAQLSDLHIRERGRQTYRRLDTGALLSQTIDAVLALPQRPDAVLLTGDLVDHGAAAQYAHLRERLAPLPMPAYLLPGNHDDPAAMAGAFPEHDYLARALDETGGFAQYWVRIGPVCVVALDTTVRGVDHGALCDARLDWLERTLARLRGEPVVIAMHHPPFATLLDFMDGIGLRSGTERLAAIVRAHDNIERIVCGHLHRAIDVRFAGTVASTCPSPAHQIWFDLERGVAPKYVLETPAFRVLAHTPSAGVVAHLVPVGRFDGPHDFVSDAGVKLL